MMTVSMLVAITSSSKLIPRRLFVMSINGHLAMDVLVWRVYAAGYVPLASRE
jgi:hypothetical protein